MKVVAVALLGLGLAGCAPAAQPQAKVPAAPVSAWHDTSDTREGTEDVAPVGAAGAARLSEVSALLGAAESGAPADPGAEGPLGPFEPEVVHRARIAMAREALVEDNLNKARVDLAEELMRELAALQESSGTNKSRVKHVKPTMKQP